MRETIVLILCAILLAVAAFEGGYIYRDRAAGPGGPLARREADELRKQIYQLDIKTRDINGRLVGVEGTVGSRQKAVGRRERTIIDK